MKQLSIILLASAFAVFITSCNDTSAKETNAKHEVQGITRSTANIISYKANGELITTSGWNINRFKVTNASKESLTITTNMHDEKRTISVNIDGIEPGEYVAETDNKSDHAFYGSYFPDYNKDASNYYIFQTGSFTITSIDTVKNILSATFWGTAENLKGERINISDGKIINGRLAEGTMIYE